MRILLSADWRLGRAFHGAELLAEQASLIEQLVTVARERRVDAVLLAGGLLQPGAGSAARELLDSGLAELALDAKVPVVALLDEAGPAAGRGVLERVGVHLHGRSEPPREAVELTGDDGLLLVQCAPEARPEEAVAAARELSRTGPPGARRILLGRLPDDEDARRVGRRLAKRERTAMACAVLGGGWGESELVPGRAFRAPAPMPSGFDDLSECGLGLLDIDEAGELTHELLPLEGAPAPLRLAGSLDQLLALDATDSPLRAEVTDPGLVPGLDRLAERFPGLRELVRPAPGGEGGPAWEHLFLAHRANTDAEPPSELERELLRAALARVGR